MGYKVVRNRKPSATVRRKRKQAYRKRRAKMKRYAQRYRKKSSVRRRMKRVSRLRKQRHLKKGQRLRLASADTAANMMENKFKLDLTKGDAMDKEIAALQESINQFSQEISVKKSNSYAEAFRSAARTAEKLHECYSKINLKPVVEEREFDEFDISFLPEMIIDDNTSEMLSESFQETLGIKKKVVESTEESFVKNVMEDLKQLKEQSEKLASMSGSLDESEAKEFLEKSQVYLSKVMDMISEDEMDEHGEKFKALTQKLVDKGAKDPSALASWIGRNKMGKEAFQKKALAGKHEEIDEAGGNKAKMIAAVKKIEAELHEKMAEAGVEAPGHQDIPFKVTGYDAEMTQDEDGKKVHYPEMLHFNIESWDTMKMSILADGKIVPEGSSFSGAGISKEKLIEKVIANVKAWAAKAKAKTEDVQSGQVFSKDNKFFVKNQKTGGYYELHDQSKAHSLAGAMVDFNVGSDGKAVMTESADFSELEKAYKEKGLDERQILIATAVTQGLSNAEIANQMFETEADIKTALFTIYKKIGVEGRAKLIIWSLKNGGKLADKYSDVIAKHESMNESVMDEAKLEADKIKAAVDTLGEIIAASELEEEDKKIADAQLTMILKVVEAHEESEDKGYLNAAVIKVCTDQLEEIVEKGSKELMEKVDEKLDKIVEAVAAHEALMKEMGEKPASEGPEEIEELAEIEEPEEIPEESVSEEKKDDEYFLKICNDELGSACRDNSREEKIEMGKEIDKVGIEAFLTTESVGESLNEREGNGLDEVYPELDIEVHNAVKDAFASLERAYDLFSGDVEQIEHKSRDGFISSNDGGYRARGFTDISHLIGSGSHGSLPEKAEKAIEDLYEIGCGYAKDALKEKYAEQLKDVPDDKITYNDLTEMGKSDLAEKLSGLEMENNGDESSTVMFELIAMYDHKSSSFTIQGVVNWEAPYHRNKSNFEAYYQSEVDFTEKEVGVVGEKIKAELKKAVDFLGA